MRRFLRSLPLMSLCALPAVGGGCVAPGRQLAFTTGALGTGSHTNANEGTGGANLAALGTSWVTVGCEGCETSHVEIDMRRSIAPNGGPGVHVFARVRNRNAYPVALVVAVAVDRYNDEDGPIFDTYPMSLGAAGNEDAERTVLLRSTEVRAVSVHQVERY